MTAYASITRQISLVTAVLLTCLITAPSAAQVTLKVKDIKVGTGAEAVIYSTVTVHYTGRLMNGIKFDSSLDRNQPFRFTIGRRQVIAGWDQGVKGMRVGGKRELIIPPHLGYGSRGAGNAIPPNSVLKFKIELLAVNP
jgi:FKBP-type peptidyl-prolyl cis-trans isomerase